MNKHTRARVLVERGSQIVYNIIPKVPQMANYELLQGQFYQDFTFFEEKGCVIITSNNANQKLLWQCKQRHG